jgi:hypothetical protein
MVVRRESSTVLTGPGPAPRRGPTRWTSPGISFPGTAYTDFPIILILVVFREGVRLQDVCGLDYTGGMCQDSTPGRISHSLSKAERVVGSLRLLRGRYHVVLCFSGGLVDAGSVGGVSAAHLSRWKENVGLQKVDKCT